MPCFIHCTILTIEVSLWLACLTSGQVFFFNVSHAEVKHPRSRESVVRVRPPYSPLMAAEFDISLMFTYALSVDTVVGWISVPRPGMHDIDRQACQSSQQFKMKSDLETPLVCR